MLIVYIYCVPFISFIIYINLLLATRRSVFSFIAVENDASKCVEMFCYTVLILFYIYCKQIVTSE